MGLLGVRRGLPSVPDNGTGTAPPCPGGPCPAISTTSGTGQTSGATRPAEDSREDPEDPEMAAGRTCRYQTSPADRPDLRDDCPPTPAVPVVSTDLLPGAHRTPTGPGPTRACRPAGASTTPSPATRWAAAEEAGATGPTTGATTLASPA